MALSEELKKIYSSNPNDKRAYDTVEISHSRFSKVFYMVQDDESHSWKLENGSTVRFEAFGFNIKLPEVGAENQDISFAFDNVSRVAMPELERAAGKIEEPIKLVYRAYVDGASTPQTSPITLMLTNIVADNQTISAVATKSDLYKRMIPSGHKAYFDSDFQGLWL